MTRIQYQKGVKLPKGAVYCARTRYGLTDYANPFKNDAKSRIWQYTEGKWRELDYIPPILERSAPTNLFGEAQKVVVQKPFVGSINIFKTLLYDYEADLEGWVVADDVRLHMAKMNALAAVELDVNAQMACWCSLDQPCHVDVIIEVRKRMDSLPLAF